MPTADLPTQATPTDELPPWLASAMAGLGAGKVDAWLDVFAEDAVHEFPFAAPEMPRRLEGREAMRSYLTALFGKMSFGSVDGIRVHEADDATVIEAQGHHRDAAGNPFDLDYVWIITRRDGRVTRLRDYMGPHRPAAEEH